MPCPEPRVPGPVCCRNPTNAVSAVPPAAGGTVCGVEETDAELAIRAAERAVLTTLRTARARDGVVPDELGGGGEPA